MQTNLHKTNFATTHNGSPQELDSHRLAKALGWFSIGLGLAELLAPRRVARMTGLNDHKGLVQLMGIRELASGVGILTDSRPVGWMQARVAGDAMDMTVLGAALVSSKSNRSRVLATAAAVASVSALDFLCSSELTSKSISHHGIIHFEESVTINRSPEELYAFWKDFENLPRFMSHLESVRIKTDGLSHWVAKAPAGKTVEWTAEIVEDIPHEKISWCSLPGADVDNRGEVLFTPATGDRGTVVKVKMDYRPPLGLIGARVAGLFGEAPEKQVAVDLRRFKQLMETGEIARTRGQAAGRSHSTSRKYDDFVRA